MKTTSHYEESLDQEGPVRWAWLPIPLLLMAIIVMWAADLRTSYEAPYLQMGLNFLFSTLVSLFVAYLAGRSFLVRGTPGLLLLGCGVVIWGASGVMAVVGNLLKADHGFDPNIATIINNTCVWLSALCHLIGVSFVLRTRLTLPAPRLWLAGGYLIAAAGVGLIVLAALSGGFPVFFVQGQGGTPVRQFVLGSAIAMFLFTSLLLRSMNHPRPSPFLSWYSLALQLLAVGYFGVLVQSVVGGLLGWTGRAAQLLGGIYMLIAAIASRRESQVGEIALGQALTKMEQRYGVAVAIVTAFAVVRLAFLPALGARTIFVTFYTAVVLAALYGGLPAGLLATLLSALLIIYFWIAPVGHFSIADPNDWMIMAIFLASCTVISWITELMHRAQARAVAAQAEASFAIERGLAADALLESEERYRNLVESAHDWTWEIDAHGVYTYSSRQVRDILGYLPEEIIGKYPFELMPEEEGARIRRHFATTSELRQPFRNLVNVNLHKDGHVVILESNGIPFFDQQGNFKGYRGMDRDITERRQIEEELRQNEERLRLVLEASSMGTFEFDLRSGQGHWNTVEFGLLGLKPGTIPENPESFFRHVHPGDLELLRARWNEALQTGELDTEFRIIRADDEERWLVGKGRFVFEGAAPEGGDGSVRFMGVNYDITDRKRLEDALQQYSEALELRVGERTAELEEQSRILESFFKHTPTSLVFLDAQFNFIRVNEAYARKCHLNTWDFPGKNHFDLYPSDELKREFQRVVDTRQPYYVLERPFSFSDHHEWGVSYWDLGVTPITNEKQDIEFLVFTLNDVTDRKKSLDELREKDRLIIRQSRLAAMGEMINNIAHQWRQPLNTLGMNIQRLSVFYELGGFNKEFLDTSVRDAMKLIQHMSQTIDDFRNFFKPDRVKSDFDVNQIISQTISLVSDGFKANQLEIVVHTACEAMVNGYPGEFSQALLNIVQNAREALLESCVDNGRVTISSTIEGGRPVITISDNAGGIPEDVIDKVFEPYFSTKGLQGTGIGLYMSKKIIEDNMGGRITVRNTAEGAEFRIEV